MTVWTKLGHRPRQPEIQLSPYLASLPDGTVVGAFNAGRWGYVARKFPGLTVINLDCLVNNIAFDAVRHGEYLQYIESHVNVLVDNPGLARMFLSTQEMDSLKSRMVRRR